MNPEFKLKPQLCCEVQLCDWFLQSKHQRELGAGASFGLGLSAVVVKASLVPLGVGGVSHLICLPESALGVFTGREGDMIWEHKVELHT